MEDQPKEIPDILTRANNERFRRRLLIGSRMIALGLILAIFYIGYIQMVYVQDINQLLEDQGPLGYCSLCGSEAFRSCSCVYLPDADVRNPNFDKEAYGENLATGNIADCEVRLSPSARNINISGLEDIFNSSI